MSIDSDQPPFGDSDDPNGSSEFLFRSEPLVEETVDTKYRLAGGPEREKLSEEIKLVKALTDAIQERLPSDVPEDQLALSANEIVGQDPELLAILARIKELGRDREGPVLWDEMPKWAEEEAAEGESPSSGQ